MLPALSRPRNLLLLNNLLNMLPPPQPQRPRVHPLQLREPLHHIRRAREAARRERMAGSALRKLITLLRWGTTVTIRRHPVQLMVVITQGVDKLVEAPLHRLNQAALQGPLSNLLLTSVQPRF